MLANAIAGSVWMVFVYSFIVALPATWLCKKIALKIGIVDKPDGLVKTHKRPIAYLGGLGIFAGLAAGIIIGILCLKNAEAFPSYLKLLAGIIIGAGIACLVGVIDDIFDIRPWQKIIGQLSAAAVLIYAGVRPEMHYLFSPFGLELSPSLEFWLGAIISILFVLGATNSLNLLDGIDGLCAGVAAIIALGTLGAAMLWGHQAENGLAATVIIICSLCLMGAVCGFLPFNINPASIFMGDTGSLLLGCTIAAMFILFTTAGIKWWLISLMLFGLPILDTSVAMARRLLNKRPMFVSDRGHIYDQMIDRGIPLKKTVLLSYGITALYVIIGLLMCLMQTPYAAATFTAAVIVSAAVVWKKGFLKMEGIRGAIRHSEN
jgi:UDP-GlcNAc:undecaprenyl-phosphate GlcNAc-1-phosphate transferase